jgi:hypothetical protein
LVEKFQGFANDRIGIQVKDVVVRKFLQTIAQEDRLEPCALLPCRLLFIPLQEVRYAVRVE